MAAGWAACGREPGADATGRVLRFIERDPQVVSDPNDFWTWAPTREWTFGGDQGLAPWVVPRDTGWDGLIFDLPTELTAEDADGVELVVRNLKPATKVGATFLWLVPQGGFSTDRSAPLTCASGGEELYLCKAALRGRPGWAGRIVRLRFMSSIPAAELEVLGAHLLERSGATAELARDLGSAAKIEMAGEVRNALLVTPGAARERRLRVPPGSALRFAFGALTREGPVTFRVTAQPGGTLHEQVLTSGEPVAWRDADVDLSGLAGQEVVLRLEVVAPWAVDPLDAIGYWADPEVVAPPPPEAWPNVVLISVDTLRADHLSLYGYPRPTSPRLESWAKASAAVFRSAVAQAPWTLPSHASMLTGLDPFRHRCHYDRPGCLASGLNTLPEILRDAGYTTLAITGGAYLHQEYGFAQGFDRFFPADYVASRRSDNSTLLDAMSKALGWIGEQGERRFFLFFHTYETHAPYRSHQPWLSRFTGLPASARLRVEISAATRGPGGVGRMSTFTDLRSREDLGSRDATDLMVATYDSEIAFVDEQIGRLLDALRESGLDRKTLVVFTSDHGEMLGEHGLGGHMYLYDENLLVPLVVAAPGGRGAGRVIPDQVRSIDIVPTILDLAGIPGAVKDLDGVSLAPFLDGGAAKVPKTALSYNAFWNTGVSVRYDNRLKYLCNDTAWAPVAGAESVDSLAPAAGTSGDDDARSRETPRLRQGVLDAFRDRLPSLRMTFHGGPARDFHGEVAGGSIEVHRVKSVDLACPCVQFVDSKMRFRVPAETSYTVAVLTGADLRFALKLAATAADGRPAELSRELDAGTLSGELVLGLTGGGWREVPGARRPATWVSVRWQGEPPPPAREEDGGPSAEVLGQLRALGYVE